MSDTDSIIKIQVEPSQAHLLEAVEKAAFRQGVLYIMVGPKARARLLLGRLLHPFGKHTWMRWMTYDEASDRILDTGGQICEFCPRARMP